MKEKNTNHTMGLTFFLLGTLWEIQEIIELLAIASSFLGKGHNLWGV